MKKTISLLLTFFLLMPTSVFAIEDTSEEQSRITENSQTNESSINNNVIEGNQSQLENSDIVEHENTALAREYEENEGRYSIDNVESNGLARWISSGYTRRSTYIVHGNDDIVYYAYMRQGNNYYLNNGGVSTVYKDACEKIDVGDTPIRLQVTCRLFSEPAFSNRYKTATYIPAGNYTAKYVAGAFVYIESDYGDGWVTSNYDENGNYITGGRTQFLDIPSSLSVSSVNGVPIYQKYIPRYSENGRPGYGMRPKYITIHNTASTGRGANASAHANLQYNGNNRAASWHYTVDNTQIWQSIPCNENAWHAGDGDSMGNDGTVAIEICENSDGNYAQAERNAAYLTAQILFECGLPGDAIRMHRDWSGKNCPHNTIDGTKGTMGWQGFKNLVAQAYNNLARNDYNKSNVVNQGTGKVASAPTIQYTAKSRRISWQGQVTEPNTAGTTGRSLDLYQLKINMINVPNSAHLSGTVNTSVGTINYDNIESEDTIGVDGAALKQVKFNLSNVPGYRLEYRVHSSNVGWQSWVRQGNYAGSDNNNIQAIDFRLVADNSVKTTYPQIYYNGHIANKGWLSTVPDSQMAGTTGKSIFLQAIKIGMDGESNYKLSGSAYVDGKGWISYSDINKDTVIGTTGQGKALKGLKLKLDNLPGYKIQYQAHVSNVGWQGWRDADQVAGDLKNNIEAVKIRLVVDNSVIAKISFDKSDLTINKGLNEQLKVIYSPSSTSMDRTLKWTSSNEKVAKVENGKVTAINAGETIITAETVNGKKATCKVKVIIPITGVVLDQTEKTIEKGDSFDLKTTISPTNTTEDQSIKWSSENPNIAKVDSNGKVTGLGGGTTNIVATTSNGKIAKCKVSVKSHIESLMFNKKIYNVQQGESRTLAVSINPNDTTDDKSLTWKSDDETIAKIDGNGKVTGVKLGTTTITATSKNGKTTTCKVTVISKAPKVSYKTHVQDIGWQNYVSDGKTAGTSGQSKRLEAIQIKLDNNTSYKGSIQYQTHIQNIGWQGWKKDDELSGTSGQSKRLEAIKIKLTDKLAENYDIYYRVHAQNFGWLDWAKNGESAGTAGYGYRLEAIEVKIVEKDGNGPGSTTRPYVQRYVSYQTHVQDYGWQGKKYDGEISGTSGQSKRLEAINVSLSNPLYSGSIQYQTHIQDIGWQGWRNNGQMSGTSGQSKRLEAIQIKLTGEMANKYDIYYRVHAQNFGWLGWAKNGASAGTAGYSYRLEAIQIVLVSKDGSAPGNTVNSFYKK